MTVRGWWRRRQDALNKQPGGLLRLTDPMLDDSMISSAQGAAEQDYKSQAYDEFLFSEENLDQMPYERMVDDRLALTRMRLFDQARRAVLQEKHRLIAVQSDVGQLNDRREAVLSAALAKADKLEEQREILDGKKTGRAELYWPGTPPQQTTLPNALLRLMLPYAVFVIVGGVDVGIVYLSFFGLFPDAWFEAWLYTLPAIGIQVVFPHFIGDRINLLSRGHQKKRLLIGELIVLAAVWIVFVFTLTEFRMNKILESLDTDNPLISTALYVGFICMMLGLGLWLLLIAARHNPHETAYARINFAIGRLERKAAKLRQMSLAAAAAMPAIEESLEVAEQGYRDAIESAPVELADAVKSVYRRTLINLSHDVDFTSAYLGVAHPNAKAARKNKKTIRAQARERRQGTYNPEAEFDRRRQREGFRDSTEIVHEE